MKGVFIMRSSSFFSFPTNSNYVILKNNSLVHIETPGIVIDALARLMKSDYDQYVIFVDFCKSRERKLSCLRIESKSFLKVDCQFITEEDIINVVCCAVDNDMVIGSPFPKKPRVMYPRCTKL